MGLEVFTAEWAEACRRSLQERGRFREVGAGWNRPVALLMRPDPSLGITATRAIQLQFSRGECVAAGVATPAQLESVDFLLAADAKQWKRMLDGDLDPITAVMLGKLKLERGSLAALLPHPAVARELIAAARAVDTVFPKPRSRETRAS